MSWREVGAVPAKADPAEQAQFLGEKPRPGLSQARRGRRAVPSVDAAHFVYGPFLGFLWCLLRRLLPGPSGRKRCSVPAALGAVTRRVIRVANGSYSNAESVCDPLRLAARAGLPGPAALVPGNARYQRCALVQDPARPLGIELLPLPGYSPNLNLIERPWKFVKKETLASRSLPPDDAFTRATDECLNHLPTRYKAQMDTLLTLNFHLFEEEPYLTV